MTDDSRPKPGQLSRKAGMAPARMVVLALAGTAVLGVVGWGIMAAWSAYRAEEARRIMAGEHPEQQPGTAVPGIEAAPAPSAIPAAPALPAPTQLGEAFVERFDRSSVSDRWFISDGWSNGSWMANDWRRSAVKNSPGLLTLHLQRGMASSAFELEGGEVRTHDFHRYGYFEVRMRAPRGAGLVSGVFTYADRKSGVKPNEIDIEILGRDTRAAELTIHENGQSTSKIVRLPFDAAEDFHVYGFDWQPTFVRWYVDGALVHEETGPPALRLVRPQQLILNVWGSRDLHAWVGYLDMARAPWQLDFTCVAYNPTYTGTLCD